MTYEPEEQENFDFCGVLYRTTRDISNKIAQRVYDSNEWKRYATACEALKIVKRTEFGAHAASQFAETRTTTFRDCFKLTLRIVNEEINVDHQG